MRSKHADDAHDNIQKERVRGRFCPVVVEYGYDEFERLPQINDGEQFVYARGCVCQIEINESGNKDVLHGVAVLFLKDIFDRCVTSHLNADVFYKYGMNLKLIPI